MAIRFGASALGLVAKMPSGPGSISDLLILRIARSVPAGIPTFLLTSETSAGEIIGHHKRTHTSTIQIVDKPEQGAYEAIRLALPAIKIVQVVHVIDECSIDEAIRISQHVDALLLDSGNPILLIKELGGTGRVHNWKISREIIEQSKVPVFLAGGLTLENIKRAVNEVHPFGVDLCSGVRTNGKLDPKKLEAFMTAVLSS